MSKDRVRRRPIVSGVVAFVSVASLFLGACSSMDEADPERTGGTNSGDGDSSWGSGGVDSSTGGTSLGGSGGVASGGGTAQGSGGVLLSTGGGGGSGGDSGTGSGGEGAASGGTSGADTLIIEEAGPGYCAVNGIVENTHAGFSGSGYLNANNNAAATITWSVAISQAGDYSLTFVYANAGADRPADLMVGGVTQSANVSFPSTVDWSTWSRVTVVLSLEAGTHELRLDPLLSDGLANIDRLEVEGAGVSAGECEVAPGPDGTQPITIWLAGDSTVANGSTPCPSGWGKFLAGEFNQNVTVNNWAVGGRSVRTWLYDVTTTMGGDGECVINTDGQGDRIVQSRWTDMLAQMSEGDYLFIQFGINDGDKNCNRHVGGAAFKEEYAMMARAAKERGVQPVFLTPVSMIRCSGTTAVGSRGFLTETFDVGIAEDVPVIDLHQLSVDLYDELGFCPIPGGDVSASTTGPVGEFFCDDHTHFADTGATQIASVVVDAISELGLGLSTYRK